jgi:beta-lactam-binding protein with PASTA domain
MAGQVALATDEEDADVAPPQLERTEPEVPTMINLAGLTVDEDAYKNFMRSNALVVTQEPIDDPDAGKIVYQSVADGATIAHGAPLTIGVAMPEKFVDVPDFVGMRNESKWIKNWELQARVKVHPRFLPHLRQDPGIIFGQNVDPTTRIMRGTTITVSVVMDRPHPIRHDGFGTKLKHPIRTITGR